MPRASSPPSMRSTLRISAPKSARIIVAVGPATTVLRSRTRTPVSGGGKELKIARTRLRKRRAERSDGVHQTASANHPLFAGEHAGADLDQAGQHVEDGSRGPPVVVAGSKAALIQ